MKSSRVCEHHWVLFLSCSCDRPPVRGCAVHSCFFLLLLLLLWEQVLCLLGWWRVHISVCCMGSNKIRRTPPHTHNHPPSHHVGHQVDREESPLNLPAGGCVNVGSRQQIFVINKEESRIEPESKLHTWKGSCEERLTCFVLLESEQNDALNVGLLYCRVKSLADECAFCSRSLISNKYFFRFFTFLLSDAWPAESLEGRGR